MENAKEELRPFDPHQPAFRWRLWVRVVTPDRRYYHVYWRRLAGAAALGALAGWLLLAFGAWAFLRYHREWAEVRYADLALYPWRRDEFRPALGRYYIAAGQAQLQARNYRQGYSLLLAGLARVPEDLAARRTVAIALARLGLVPWAIDTLERGLTYRPDLDYLKLCFGWMLEAKRDERIVALAQQLLPARPDRLLEHQFIALESATACFQLGRYDDALRLVGDWGLADALEGQILLAQCDWERGHRRAAIERLRHELTRFAQRDELYLNLIRYERELGHQAEARRLALLRHFNDAASPGPRLDLLHSFHATDDTLAEAREIETYFRDFSRDPQALELLASFAAETNQRVLLERVIALADPAAPPNEEIAAAEIKLALASHEPLRALARCDALLAGKPRDEPATLLDGLRVLALFRLEESGRAELAFASFLERAHLRVADVLWLARQLQHTGAAASARALLQRAYALDPWNEPALAELIRLDSRTGHRSGLQEYLPRYLRVGKPAPALLRQCLLVLDQPEDIPLVQRIRDVLTTSPAVAADLDPF